MREWLKSHAKTKKQIAFRDALAKGLRGNAQLRWVKGLVDCGANPRHGGEKGMTALIALALGKEDKDECVRWLLLWSDAKAMWSEGSAMRFTGDTGKLKTASALLAHSDLTEKKEDGLSLLMLAAKNEHSDILALLLPHSAPNQRGPNGRTALMEAASGWLAQTVGDCAGLDLVLSVCDAGVKDDNGFDVFALVLECFSWVCADRFAGVVTLDRLKNALRRAPEGTMPRALAEVDRPKLVALVAENLFASVKAIQNSQNNSLAGGQTATLKNRRQ